MVDLARLVNPRSVAVIGGAPAAAVVRQCQKLGYTGKIWPVHPKKADMQTRLDAAELLTLRAAWNDANGNFDDSEMAMAKVFASEMCQYVTDEAIQIFGGMGLMDELPLERMWRDTRVDRIWDGTSEIQRHIISRQLLRKFGG